MNKMLLEQEKETEEVADDDALKNDDERYFKDNFLFMDGVKSKPQVVINEEKDKEKVSNEPS